MELKASSPKQEGLSPSDCNSDPEEKEISDDDDDDRNHKHRRRDTRSQSLERDTPDPAFARPFRKRKPFPNGNTFRENESQAGANWKNHNSNHLVKDSPGKFDRRRPGHASMARTTMDLSQRFRPNHPFSGDPGLARGRMRDLGLWNQHDSRFVPDLASQVVQGSIPPGIFAGRGLPNVSNGPNPSWNAYGVIPGIPNGGLDALHSIGLQGPLRPPIPAALNMGIPLQRCRDFEERGFCLRGDMCPMEHGINRIVIEDVQSLSQFNLPVSLPSGHLLGPSSGVGPGSLASMNSSSAPPMNSKGLHSKISKTSFADDGLGINGSGSGSAAGADFYDPDQPLWNNNGPETSNMILGLHSNKTDETEMLTNGDPSDSEFPVKISGNAAGSNMTTVWGRIGSSKGRPDLKEKHNPGVSSSDNIENGSKENKVVAAGAQNSFRQGRRVIKEDAGLKPIDSSAKSQFDTTQNPRKPSQKALRTLFVNGVPLKNNKRENLLSHFQKFGEIIDVYIPVNTERAFVQFSKKEEAEAALKAPDAVMGNRFIKLWWANRDSIPDDSSSSTSATLHGASAPFPPHTSLGSSKRENLQATAPISSAVQNPEVPVSDSSKPLISNGPKVVPPSQKKLDTLEQLKEELRKKQELLEQKRNDFKRKLVKLEKQATGSKSDLDVDQVSKKPKVEIEVDVSSVTTPRSSDSVPVVKSPYTNKSADKNKSGENSISHSPKTNASVVLQEPTSSKQHQIRPFAASGPPFLMNRYKLDNRPTAFRILPPLPAGFASVAAVKEHLLPYGEISSVEIEDTEASSGCNEPEPPKECSVRVSFVTRRSAERAFVTGRCWQGHDLKFVWLNNTSTPSSEISGGREKSFEDDVKKPEEENNTALSSSHTIVLSKNLEEPKEEEEEEEAEEEEEDEAEVEVKDKSVEEAMEESRLSPITSPTTC